MRRNVRKERAYNARDDDIERAREGSQDDRIALYAKEAERIFKETDYATNLVGYSYGLNIASYHAGEIDDAIRAFDDPKAARVNANAPL